LSVPENSGGLIADQSNLPAFNTEQAAFAQADHVTVVIDLDEFQQTFFARLALMTFGVRVEVVRVDLKRHERERVERGGSMIGISLVVLIVGQATFEPALQPM
jgi:hypothetical protein